jgi:hypothetical protein
LETTQCSDRFFVIIAVKAQQDNRVVTKPCHCTALYRSAGLNIPAQQENCDLSEDFIDERPSLTPLCKTDRQLLVFLSRCFE